MMSNRGEVEPPISTPLYRPLFVHEERSERVIAIFATSSVIRISALGTRTDQLHGLPVFREDISPAQFAAAAADLDADLRAQRLRLSICSGAVGNIRKKGNQGKNHP